MKKLKLNKEVIAELSDKDLKNVQGGEGTGSDRLCTHIPCYSAGCPTRFNCPTLDCPTITTTITGA